jgi:hypothetical protein
MNFAGRVRKGNQRQSDRYEEGEYDPVGEPVDRNGGEYGAHL